MKRGVHELLDIEVVTMNTFSAKSSRPISHPVILLFLLSLLVLNGCGSSSSGGGPILIANDDSATTVEGAAVWIDVLDNDAGSGIRLVEASWPSHGTVTILPEDKGISYQPDAGFTGSDRFTYTINGLYAGADTATVYVTVRAANSEILAAANDTATTIMNAPVLVDVLANDSGIGNQIKSVSVPANGTASIEGAVIKYQPTIGYTGTDTFTYEVKDQNSAVAKAAVTVFIREKYFAPVAVDDLASVRESAPEPIQIDVLSNDSDHDGDPLSIVAVTLAANGTVTLASTSSISYWPSPGFSGTDSFNYTISDGLGGTAVASVNLTVTPNTPPVAIIDLVTIAEGISIFINVLGNDFDADGDQLSVTAVTQPANGTATLEGGGVRYTPNTGYLGTDNFTYTINDGYGGTDTQDVRMTVVERDSAPVAFDDDVGALTGETVRIYPLFNDLDADGHDLIIIRVTPSANGSTHIVEDVPTIIEYTSTIGFIGTDSFKYTVSDGHGGEDDATVTVNVRETNTYPVAVNDYATTEESTPLFINVLANDSDADGDPLYILGPSDDNAVQKDNGIWYTPPAGFTGIATFGYTVWDGIEYSDIGYTDGNATVTVLVTASINTAPVAVEDFATTTVGTSIWIDVLANDSDADGDPLSVTDIFAMSNASATIQGDGVWFTPDAGFIGIVGFNYEVSDGLGGTAIALVTVTVATSINTPPVGGDDFATTTEGTPVWIDVLANDSDADGDPLQVQNIIGAYASLSGNGIKYERPVGFTGTDTFTYQAFDGLVRSNTVTVTVTVTPLSVVTRVSVDSSGNQATGSGFFLTGSPAVSGDGRYVAFRSDATNLVANDTNSLEDVFLHDIQTGATTLISVGQSIPQANGASRDLAISADGRYVAFRSAANNLLTTVDSNIDTDIFLRDTQAGTTIRASIDSAGNQSNGTSYYPDISADGRYVVYYSAASNLVSGDANGVMDVFLHDTQTGDTTRISVASDGTEANGNSIYPAISADGRYVAFESTASNLVTGDTNNKSDIFLHDTQTATTTRVSVDSSGIESNNPSRNSTISADGRYVAFEASASNLVGGDTNSANDIFVRDTIGNTTTRVSVASDGTQSNLMENSNYPAISDDGRYVTFYSSASNLVTGDSNVVSDIFLHDRQTGATIRVSVDSAGTQTNGASVFPEISADGRYVVYYSAADNLVSVDSNGVDDAFRVDVTALP